MRWKWSGVASPIVLICLLFAAGHLTAQAGLGTTVRNADELRQEVARARPGSAS